MSLIKMFESELVRLQEEEELFENYGNLKFLRKEFIKALIYWSTHKGRNEKAGGLRRAFGPESMVEVRTLRSAVSVFSQFEEANGPVAFVMFTGENIHDKDAQFCICARTEVGGSGNPDINFAVTEQFMKSLPADALKKIESFLSVSLSGMVWTMQKYGHAVQTLKYPKMKAVVGAIVSYLKSEKIDFRVGAIFRDQERAVKVSARYTAKQGMVYTPKEMKAMGWNPADMEKAMKYQLKSRLEEFKRTNAKGPKSDEDLLEWITENGYFDKMKLEGTIYERYEISMSDKNRLRSGESTKDDRWSGNYVEYRIADDERRAKIYQPTKKIEEFLERVAADRGLTFQDDEIVKLGQKAFAKAKIPPVKFRVLLALRKSAIVPVEIFFEQY